MKNMLGKSVLALALAAGMTSAAYATQGVSDTEVVIGSNGDLSGVFAAFNVGAIKAAQQVFDEVNAKGGIAGRKIRFVVEDHGYQVPKAVQNFNKLINSDQVFAMILNLGTPHNIAGFPLMQQHEVANVAPLTAARQMLEEPITYKYAGFSSYYDQLRYGLKYLVKETGAKNLCAMYYPQDFGLEIYEATKDEAQAEGLNYAAETTHKPGEQDFVGAIQKLKQAGCNIVSTAIGVRETITAYATARKLGWNDVAFIGSSAGFNTAVAKVPGGITEGYYAAAGWVDFEDRLDVPEVKAWADAYQKASGNPADTAAQLGYGAAMTLVKALEAAGKDLTSDSFRKAMESLKYEDVINDVPIDVGPDHQGGTLIVVNQIKGGKWIEVGRVDPAAK